MKFGSSWVVKAPCKKDGVECSKRVFGCRNTCKEYAEYEKKLADFKDNMYSQKREEARMNDYVAKQKHKRLSGKNYERY